MAADIIRTVDDDVTDALAALDAAAREVANWRAHLQALKAQPEPGTAMQARRSFRVVAAVIADAADHTENLLRRTAGLTRRA